MEVITIESNAFKNIVSKFDEINEELKQLKEGKLASEYLNTEQAMAFLKVQSDKTLYNLRKSGKLPYTTLGAKVLYKKYDLIKILEDNRILDRTSY